MHGVNCNADGNAYAGTHIDGDSNPNPDAGTNSDVRPSAHSHTDPDADPNAKTRGDRYSAVPPGRVPLFPEP